MASGRLDGLDQFAHAGLIRSVVLVAAPLLLGCDGGCFASDVKKVWRM